MCVYVPCPSQTCIYTGLLYTYTYMHAYIHTHTCMHIYIHIHACIANMHLHSRSIIYIHIHACTLSYTHTRVECNKEDYLSLHTHTNTHTHIRCFTTPPAESPSLSRPLDLTNRPIEGRARCIVYKSMSIHENHPGWHLRVYERKVGDSALKHDSWVRL
jgi:hypothetical protein